MENETNIPATIYHPEKTDQGREGDEEGEGWSNYTNMSQYDDTASTKTVHRRSHALNAFSFSSSSSLEYCIAISQL